MFIKADVKGIIPLMLFSSNNTYIMNNKAFTNHWSDYIKPAEFPVDMRRKDPFTLISKC